MRVFSTGWSEGFDGPGRRWVVYLKGCDYRCLWCANPEGIASETEILFHAARADHADAACPQGAVARVESAWWLDRKRCARCEDAPCVALWRHPAFERAGEEISVEALVAQATAARPLFGADGGVTFGGGEPTLQTDDLLQALARLRNERVHTALETNAGSPAVRRFIGKADLIIADLKCVDPNLHRQWTGADNREALDNLKVLAREQKRLVVHVPLITGMNDSPQEKKRVADFLVDLAAERPSLQVEVLRLHHLGEPKYVALDREYPMSVVAPPTCESAEAFVKTLKAQGLNASLGEK